MADVEQNDNGVILQAEENRLEADPDLVRNAGLLAEEVSNDEEDL